jgi:CheY-like chemotaxis protein
LISQTDGSLGSVADAAVGPGGVPSEAQPRSEGREPSAVSILLVDDDDFMRETVADILSALGYEVAHASNGNAALEILSNDGWVDILLTDLAMADMGGLELAQRVRGLYRLMPIVFVSGSAEIAEVPSELHPYRLIQKPFRISDLEATIAAALSQPPIATSL